MISEQYNFSPRLCFCILKVSVHSGDANPALMPRARPCLRFGKKNEMLLMEEAKAPPPIPLAPASTTKELKAQFGFESTRPIPIIGIIASAEFIVLCIRVPQIATRKVFTTRNVAPVRPAIDGNDDTAT